MKIDGIDIKIQGRIVHTAIPELDKCECLDNPSAVIESLRGSRIRIDLLTFMQIMPETSPKYDYHMEWDNLAVVTVSTFDGWWTKLKSEARNRARQAEKKGISIREAPFDDALVRGMWEVYNESPIRQGKPNIHYGKDIETVHREEATFLDRSIFIGAFIGEKLIGFVKLVTDANRTHANLVNIVSMMIHRDKAPTNALIAASVRYCADHGIRYLAYQNFTYGRKKPDSLTNFKEINGFQRVDLPRYYVPITPLGEAALQLGLHHKIVDRLPEQVTDKLREFRTAWYRRKLQPATESQR